MLKMTSTNKVQRWTIHRDAWLEYSNLEADYQLIYSELGIQNPPTVRLLRGWKWLTNWEWTVGSFEPTTNIIRIYLSAISEIRGYSKEQNFIAYPYDLMMFTLAHELAHVKQWENGELEYQYVGPYPFLFYKGKLASLS